MEEINVETQNEKGTCSFTGSTFCYIFDKQQQLVHTVAAAGVAIPGGPMRVMVMAWVMVILAWVMVINNPCKSNNRKSNNQLLKKLSKKFAANLLNMRKNMLSNVFTEDL